MILVFSVSIPLHYWCFLRLLIILCQLNTIVLVTVVTILY